ncbi:MAG: hypothetical protein JNL98_17760 [Bryobacterales bacterium]|nr:hypothetical protein [Bryobacterales bacterium]
MLRFLLLSFFVPALSLAQPPGTQAFNDGLAAHSAARYDDAIRLFEEARRANYQPAPAPLFRIARAWSMKNDPSMAADWLQQAADTGFANLALLLNDSDFNNARRDPRFGGIAHSIDLNGKPCMTNARFREFDFWIGEWNVTRMSDGAPSGSNEVLGILDGCVVMENWVPHNGNRGRAKSFTFLDPASGKWRQIYVTDNGQVLDFTGELRDGAMHFTREYDQQGRRIQERMSFTPVDDGDVRQLWELSPDGGRNWSVLFDGRYRQKRKLP